MENLVSLRLYIEKAHEKQGKNPIKSNLSPFVLLILYWCFIFIVAKEHTDFNNVLYWLVVELDEKLSIKWRDSRVKCNEKWYRDKAKAEEEVHLFD